MSVNLVMSLLLIRHHVNKYVQFQTVYHVMTNRANRVQNAKMVIKFNKYLFPRINVLRMIVV